MNEFLKLRMLLSEFVLKCPVQNNMKRGLPRNARMIELANKDVKIAIINMIHLFKMIEGNMNMMRKEAEDI